MSVHSTPSQPKPSRALPALLAACLIATGGQALAQAQPTPPTKTDPATQEQPKPDAKQEPPKQDQPKQEPAPAGESKAAASSGEPDNVVPADDPRPPTGIEEELDAMRPGALL